ncbi:hypothetical protein BGZ65_008191, partial [Modicella reniformis]
MPRLLVDVYFVCHNGFRSFHENIPENLASRTDWVTDLEVLAGEERLPSMMVKASEVLLAESQNTSSSPSMKRDLSQKGDNERRTKRSSSSDSSSAPNEVSANRSDAESEWWEIRTEVMMARAFFHINCFSDWPVFTDDQHRKNKKWINQYQLVGFNGFEGKMDAFINAPKVRLLSNALKEGYPGNDGERSLQREYKYIWHVLNSV